MQQGASPVNSRDGRLSYMENGIWRGPLSPVRAAFWIIGLTCGGILAYTTRHYLNSDGMTYIEMADGFRNGNWSALVNLACSPAYPVVLAGFQALLNTDVLNELPLLKTANLLCFVAAMAAADLFVRLVVQEMRSARTPAEEPIDQPLLTALMCFCFLIVSLTWVRMRLVNPDMMVFFLFLLCMSIIFWIRKAPEPVFKYVLLGLTAGLGYLTKTYFLPYSLVLFAVAAGSSLPLKRSLPRVLWGVIVMAVVSAPLIAAISYRLERFSFGEVGRHAYTSVITAEGSPKFSPRVLLQQPLVLYYELNAECTDHRGFEVAHWSEGIRPSPAIGPLLRAVLAHVLEFLTHNLWFTLAVGFWIVTQLAVGGLKAGKLWPLPLPVALAIPAVAGIGMFSLVHLEPRYVAPFAFVGFAALLTWPTYPIGSVRKRSVGSLAGILLALCFLAVLIGSTVDQSMDGLRSTDRRLSYRDGFLEERAVADYLHQIGAAAGDVVAVVDSPPLYWGRMGRFKIKGEVPGPEEFFSAEPSGRTRVRRALAQAGVKALVGQGSAFNDLIREGWEKVPGTRAFFVLPIHTGPR